MVDCLGWYCFRSSFRCFGSVIRLIGVFRGSGFFCFVFVFLMNLRNFEFFDSSEMGFSIGYCYFSNLAYEFEKFRLCEEQSF